MFAICRRMQFCRRMFCLPFELPVQENGAAVFLCAAYGEPFYRNFVAGNPCLFDGSVVSFGKRIVFRMSTNCQQDRHLTRLFVIPEHDRMQKQQLTKFLQSPSTPHKQSHAASDDRRCPSGPMHKAARRCGRASQSACGAGAPCSTGTRRC